MGVFFLMITGKKRNKGMKYYFYRLEGQANGKVSIAPEVDLFYWQKRGEQIVQMAETPSVGQAFAMARDWGNRSSILAPWQEPLEEEEIAALRGQAAEIYALAAGRVLLWEELERLLHQYDKWPGSCRLRRALQWLGLAGMAEIRPAVRSTGPPVDWKCERCGYQGSLLRQTPCAKCGEKCVVCEHCLLLGRARTCFPLFVFQPLAAQRRVAPESLRDVALLTEAQTKTVAEIRANLGQNRQLLVWAVTGAGKTEIMMPIVADWLNQGKKVLWVTPRKDVVLELKPRLEKGFAGRNVVALYGGSAQTMENSQLVIATAHQVLRFYQSFDLAVIDEVDAFPLYGNRALENGIWRALSPQAKQILLTATPPPEWRALHRRGILPAVLLPVRYHGYPLPEPVFKREWQLWKKLSKKKPIKPLSVFLRQVVEREGQAFIFVPRVEDVKRVLFWLKHCEPGIYEETCGVFAGDPHREQTVRQFREGKWRFLVTTTILERGVTLPSIHVVIIGADHPVFTAAALIQMAGRVGRSAAYQSGEVWFLAEEKTEPQNRAKREIKWLNDCAKKEGFLKDGAYNH
jgi:competence protein ComFA